MKKDHCSDKMGALEAARAIGSDLKYIPRRPDVFKDLEEKVMIEEDCTESDCEECSEWDCDNNKGGGQILRKRR